MVHKRLHHVGIILPTEEAVKDVMDAYGLEVDYEGMTPYDTKFIFTKMNPEFSDSPVEFLIPYSGVLAEYNKGKGGIHHICWEVDDVEAACEEFKEKGFGLLHEDECPIAGGFMKINFVRPKFNHGILVELMEILEK